MIPEPRSFFDVIRSGKFLVLDTETTGINEGEIVQIAIINAQGETLLDTLVRPYEAIPRDATRIHGINNLMVADAPTWQQITAKVKYLIEGKDLIVYNALYDRRMMHQSNEAWGLPKIDWAHLATWHCAMLEYARYHGEWNDWANDYRWQKLGDACRQMGIEVNGAHSALGDCLMTLAVCKAMISKSATLK
jgi:DNA polymerase-3 subunit epsilon